MLLTSLLNRLTLRGHLTVIDAGGKHHRFGSQDTPAVTIRLHDKRLHHRLCLNPELYLGEAYTDGTLTIEGGSLYELLHLGTANSDALTHHPMQRLRQRLDQLWKSVQQFNPTRRARRMSPITMICPIRFTICFSAPIGNIPAPIIRRAPRRSKKRSIASRSISAQSSCCGRA